MTGPRPGAGCRAWTRRPLGAVVLAAALLPALPTGGLQARAAAPADAGADPTLLAVNAALGGITAGVSRALAGEGFWRGLAHGMAGGAAAYAGKRLAASHIWGSGLAGRQFHALGTSAVSAGASGRDLLDSVVLPLGPLRVDVGRNPGPHHPRVRLSLADAVATAWAVGTSELTFDPRASLSTGALVFDARGRTIEVQDVPMRGATLGGVVLLSGIQESPDGLPYRDARAEALAHESVHILQHDFAEQLWTGPLERGVIRRLPGGDRVPAWLETDLFLTGATALAAATGMLKSQSAPWEVEARRLAGPVEFR